jgi:hypothetical protein
MAPEQFNSKDNLGIFQIPKIISIPQINGTENLSYIFLTL